MRVGDIVQANESTGLRAKLVSNEGNITIYNRNNVATGATLVKIADMKLHQYGRSKVMHWNDRCAKPNASQESSKIGLLDGLLSGYRTCKNCYGRTRFFKN